MFIELLYEWEYEGEKQEGIITIGYRKNKDEYFATWIDTWHMSSDFMLLTGTCKDNEVKLFGEYEVEGYPNWGWKISIMPEGKNMKIAMLNISPDKVEYPAVDISLSLE